MISIPRLYQVISNTTVKSLVAELTYLHTQSVWGFRKEMIQAVGLAACCNYFSKKKNSDTILLLEHQHPSFTFSNF